MGIVGRYCLCDCVYLSVVERERDRIRKLLAVANGLSCRGGERCRKALMGLMSAGEGERAVRKGINER